MLSLIDNIIGEEFRDFISVHLDYADSFSLTKNRWSNNDTCQEHIAILNALAPYLIHTVHSEKWFCQRVPKENEFEVSIFKFNQETARILSVHYNSLFYDESYKGKPEDLCFFLNNKLITGSVTHEGICFSYIDGLYLPGRWEKTTTMTKEQIDISIY